MSADQLNSLADFFCIHSFPSTLTFLPATTATTATMSSQTMSAVRSLLSASATITREERLLNHAHTLLVSHILPHLDTYNIRELSLNFYRRLATATSEAKDEAGTQYLSGEMGLSHFFKSYLIDPLNRLFRLPPFEHLDIYWRFVGLGPGGKPDIELVVRGKVVAVIEIKAPYAITNEDIEGIEGDVSRRRMVVVQEGALGQPRVRRRVHMVVEKTKGTKAVEQAGGDRRRGVRMLMLSCLFTSIHPLSPRTYPSSTT